MPKTNPLLGHDGQRFLWRGNYETKDTVKAAGFRWDPVDKKWWTDDVAKARSLKAYATTRALAIIDAATFSFNVSSATCLAELPEAMRDPALMHRATQYTNINLQSLLPYQQAGVVAGCQYLRQGKGVYLGDEMGLGKTAQALLMTAWTGTETMANLRRIIVICPKAVTTSWQREITKWLGNAHSVVFPASKKVYKSPPVFIIVPWSQVGKFLKACEGKGIIGEHLIVDESHYGKNPKAARTKAVYGYWKNAKGKCSQVAGIAQYIEHKPICLTGTPMPNRYIEAQTALKACGAGFAQKRDDYAKRYCYKSNPFSPRGWDDTGSINGEELYREMRASVLIRRLVSEVIRDIPPVRQQPIHLKPSTSELKKLLAVEAEEFGADDREALLESVKGGVPVEFDVMSTVRHEMGLLKVPVIIDHIKDAVENIPEADGIVVFAHHKDVIEDIAKQLNDAGITAQFAHGETKDRQAIVDQFEARQFKVFVASISACGTGLNGMQNVSSTCMFAEFPWTPGEIAQAIGRLKRIGQTASVLAQFLVIEGSLDAYIIETVLQKVITQYTALDQVQEEKTS